MRLHTARFRQIKSMGPRQENTREGGVLRQHDRKIIIPAITLVSD